MKRSSIFIIALLLITVPALLIAADVGKRDIFRVGEAQFMSESEFTVELKVVHDEDLAAMDLPLTYSEGVTLTKVTFEGTNVINFDEKIVNINIEKNQVNLGLINMVYSLKESSVLKPAPRGENIVAVLHFTLDDPTLETLEIGHYTTSAPSHSLMYVYNDFVDGVPHIKNLSPAFEGGSVALINKGSSVNLPTEFGLSQNNPNPFNPSTNISFALPKDARVNMVVFNVLGQKVRTLVDDYMAAGYQTITWDGTDFSGSTVASGVYFYKMKAGDFTDTRKMMLLK